MRRPVFRPWRSFPLMVVTGLVLGLLTGGSPVFAKEISTVALIVAMTIALTEIRLKGLAIRPELRTFLSTLGWNYGVLTALVLGIAFATPDPELRAGWVVMAAVPSAIAVIPLTSILKGNVRSALISTALLYGGSLILFPALTLLFAGRTVPPTEIAVQTLLQIGLPIAASRALARIPSVDRWRPLGVNVSFLVLVTMIAGANRTAFANLALVLGLMGSALLRTFGIGLTVLAVATRLRRRWEDRVAWTLFASFKNLGLAALLAIALMGDEAAIPALVTLLFEILWLVSLQRVFRFSRHSVLP